MDNGPNDVPSGNEIDVTQISKSSESSMEGNPTSRASSALGATSRVSNRWSRPLLYFIRSTLMRYGLLVIWRQESGLWSVNIMVSLLLLLLIIASCLLRLNVRLSQQWWGFFLLSLWIYQMSLDCLELFSYANESGSLEDWRIYPFLDDLRRFQNLFHNCSWNWILREANDAVDDATKLA